MLALRLGLALGFGVAALFAVAHPARADCGTRGTSKSGIVFVTDREPLADDRIFGGERARLFTNPRASLTTGTLAAPKLSATRGCASRLAYFQAIQRRFAQGHGRRVLVYVHGYYTSFVRAAADALTLREATHFRGAVLLYSWPATVTAKPAYGFEVRNAAWSMPHFAAFLNDLEAHFPHTRVSFVGDGAGARFAATGIAIVRGRHCARCFEHAVFLEPEIVGNALRRKLEAAHLCARASQAPRSGARITVYATEARARTTCADVETIAIDAKALAARGGRGRVLSPRIATDVRAALAGTPPTAPPRRLVRGRGRATYSIRS